MATMKFLGWVGIAIEHEGDMRNVYEEMSNAIHRFADKARKVGVSVAAPTPRDDVLLEAGQ